MLEDIAWDRLKLVHGTLFGDLFSGTCSLELCLGTCFWEPCLGSVLRSLLGTAACLPCLVALLGDLARKPVLANFLRLSSVLGVGLFVFLRVLGFLCICLSARSLFYLQEFGAGNCHFSCTCNTLEHVICNMLVLKLVILHIFFATRVHFRLLYTWFKMFKGSCNVGSGVGSGWWLGNLSWLRVRSFT